MSSQSARDGGEVRAPGLLANLEEVPDTPICSSSSDGGGPAGRIAFSDLLAADPLEVPIAVDPGTPALVGWTSGTTSSPKGVIHYTTVCAEIAQLGATSPPSDRASLVANPISHAIGMSAALLSPSIAASRSISSTSGTRPMYGI